MFVVANQLWRHFEIQIQYCQPQPLDDDTNWPVPLRYEKMALLVLWSVIWFLILFSFSVAVLILLLAVVIIATIIDWFKVEIVESDRVVFITRWGFQAVRCFSLISSFTSMFDVGDRTKPVAEYNLNVLDGVRVLAITWIIICHSSAMTQVPLLMKVSTFADYPESAHMLRNENWLGSAFILSYYYPVSIFFIIR